MDSIPPPTLTHKGADDGARRPAAPTRAFKNYLVVVTDSPARVSPAGTAIAGTVNLNVVPPRSLEATQIRPPKLRSTTSRQRYRPRPKPPWERLRPAGPVFSKRPSRLPGGRPGPRSATVTSSQPRDAARACTDTAPDVYSSALLTRLVST